MIARYLRALPFLLLTVSLWAGTPGGELGKLIPADATAVIWVQDIPGLVKRTEQHPLRLLWNDPEMQGFLAPMREKLRMSEWDRLVKEGTGRDLKEITGIAKGEMAIIVAPLSQMMANPAKPEFQMQLLMQVGKESATHALVAELMQKAVDEDRKNLLKQAAQFEADEAVRATAEPDEPGRVADKREIKYFEEQALGATLHVRQDLRSDQVRQEVAWTIQGDLLILGGPKTQVVATLGAMAAGKVRQPMIEAAAFNTVARQVGESDILFFCNLAPLISLGDAKVKAMFQQNPQNPLGITYEGLRSALRLDVLQGLYFGVTVKPESTVMQAGLNYTENQGLVRLMVTTDKPASRPAFLPLDAYDNGVASISLPNFYNTIKEIAGGISPVATGLLQAQVNNLRNATGVDVERDLLAKLGDQLAWSHAFQAPRVPGQVASLTALDQVFTLELQDAPGVELAINGLIGGLAGMGQAQDLFNEREYLGYKLRQLKTPVPGSDDAERFLTYAVAGKYLVVSLGGQAHLERVLQAMAKPGPKLWERPEVAAGLARMPANPLSVQVQELGPMVAGLIEAAIRQGNMVPGGADALELVNLEARVSPERIAKYFGTSIGCYYRTSDGIYMRVEANNPPAGR